VKAELQDYSNTCSYPSPPLFCHLYTFGMHNLEIGARNVLNITLTTV